MEFIKITHPQSSNGRSLPSSSSSSGVKDWVFFQNVISPVALICSGVSVVSGPKYIYSLKSVKTMAIDNWQSSSWTLGGKQ